MDDGKMHQMTSNMHQMSNKTTKNSENTKTLEPSWKRGFSTRKHIVIVDASASHWRCRYCGMDGYGKKFRLHYHLAGAFNHPICPCVPKEVYAKARHYVRTKRSLKRVKSGQQISSGLHVVGHSGAELRSISPLSGNGNDESNQHGPSSRLDVPKHGMEKMRNQIISKDEQKSRILESFDGNDSCSSKSLQFDQVHFSTTMHANCSSQDFAHANSKSGPCHTLPDAPQEIVTVDPLVYHEQKRGDAGVSPLMFQDEQREESSASPPVFHEQQREEAARSSDSEPGCLQGQRIQWSWQGKPIMEQGPQESRLFSGINEYEKQKSDHWTNCWRNVLDELMHSSDVQEGAGIWTCIHDALLYGSAQFGKVPDTVELADGTFNVNTAKCQNVLMDVLRSTDFVSLCNILYKATHKDGARTKYFDFGVIDSRMKNGNYGHEPGLFLHDLKLVWEDLKMAGQCIVELANRLSSLTEASCTNLVEREKQSGDNEVKGDNQFQQSDPVDLDQSGPADVSNGQKGNTCNQCGKEEASGGSIVTCTKCLLSYHISCTEPPFPSISTENWYCRNCSMDKSTEGDMILANHQPLAYCRQNCLHENCAACDRLEVCSSPKCKGTRHDNSRAMALYSVGSGEDSELPGIDTAGSCKICGNPEEEDKRFLICGHIHCRYKYYHISCLKSKQIASDFQCDRPCWYCPSCLCRVCHSDKDDDLIVLCHGCDEAYHLYCITPRRTSIPKGLWYCLPCCRERAKGGMIQYERRMLKLHRKVDTRLQRGKCDGFDLLLSAADMLRADEQLVSCTSSVADPTRQQVGAGAYR